MTITRANVELILVKRCGPLMTKAGMAVTYAGSNADLNDPIGYGLRKADYTVTDVTLVADADLSGVAVADTDKVVDLAEYRLLENILVNLDDVDVTLGPRSEKLYQLSQKIEKRLEAKGKSLQAEYGIGSAALSTGYIQNEFASHYEDTVIS